MDNRQKLLESLTKTVMYTRGCIPVRFFRTLFEELLTFARGMLFSAVIKFGIRVQNGKMKLETCRKGMRNYILF